MKLEYTVNSIDVNKKVKDILLSKLHISHRLLITLKKENCIFLNNSPIFVDKTVILNDKITVIFDYKEDNSNIIPRKMDLNIVYEDESLLVINKPSGIPVHPSINHYEDSLSNGVRYYFDKIGLKKKIRPVNRIDKDTSGLVIFAKNEYIQEDLIKQMKSNKFYKEYIAIVEGYFNDKKGTINAPIARKGESIIERCVNKNGEKAVTHYEVLNEFTVDDKRLSVVKCILETGRTHQIRVHLSYMNHPLLGDDLYGGNLSLIKRQALHSYRISFIHPITKLKINIEAKIPEDLNFFINNF